MPKTKKTTKSNKLCEYNGCKKPKRVCHDAINSRFCVFHIRKSTIGAFLSNCYSQMNGRVLGRGTKRPDIYLGKPILPKDAFFNWSKNHPTFLSLYKQWVTNNFDRKLTPTVNRMNPKRGYSLDNIEWLTNSQNCGLSGAVIKMKNRKAIYDLLGVK